MLRLKKFLKPYLLLLLAAVVAIGVQAVADLELPNLMSNIVNTGIQQKGVEQGAPAQISDDGLKLLVELTPAEQQDQIKLSYEQDNNAFRLKDNLSADSKSQLDELFANATWTLISLGQNPALQQAMTTANASSNNSNAAGSTGTGVASNTDPAAEPTSTFNLDSIKLSDIYQLTPYLPQMTDALTAAQTKAAAVDPYLKNQSTAMFAGLFLEDAGVNLADTQFNYIFQIGAIMLLVTVLSAVMAIAIGYFSSRIGSGVARDLRSRVFAKVMSFSATELDKVSSASLITRSTNDCLQIQTFLQMGIRMIIYAPCIAIGAIVMAGAKSPDMLWIMGLAALFLLVVMVIFMLIVVPKFKLIQQLIDRINLVAREALNGVLVVRAFGREQFEAERFDEVNAHATAVNKFVQRAMSLLMPILMLAMNLVTVLIVWVGAHQVEASTMQVGDMIAFIQYATQMLMGFMFIAMMFIFIPRAQVSAGRIADVLDMEPAIKDGGSQSDTTYDNAAKGQNGVAHKYLGATDVYSGNGAAGAIEFRNVSFKFSGADENALHNLNFTIPPGSTFAIIGSTGSGKSTILNLIMRFYDSSEGEILLANQNIKDLSLHDLRRHIGLAPQKAQLMSGTVLSNIAYGTQTEVESPTPELKQAAEIAQCDFIDNLEEKWQAPVAAGGSNFSGGQRQRLSIARAIAPNPDILMFDDSFSALDNTTDANLRQELTDKLQHKTKIIVAQRVSTIADAQQIMVLDKGRIVAIGSHEQLLQVCPLYKEIADSQASSANFDAVDMENYA